MAEPPSSVPGIGEVLEGKVEIRRALGQGGMGAVFEGFHRRTSRRVAVKVLRAEIAHDAAASARFLQEALACGRVRHPNVVDILDASTADGRPYLVMELLEGETLAARIAREGPMPVSDALDVMVQVLDGLAAAHASGIVHRDLKPDNLFLARSPTGATLVKVTDFGISKLTEVDSLAATTPNFVATGTGVVLGTPYYMSPEQARGRRDIDARTDIYSSGAVLFHMLAGRPPFLADNYNALLAQILMDDPPDLRVLRPEISRSLAGVVQRAMARKPEERFASAFELGERLARQTRILRDVAVLITDIEGFTKFAQDAPLEEVEELLEDWERAHRTVAAKYGGALRHVLGDAMLLTFPDVELAVRGWLELSTPEMYAPSVRPRICFGAGLARGDVRIVRSSIHGATLNAASRLTNSAPAGVLALPRILFDALPPELRDALVETRAEGSDAVMVRRR